MNGLWQSKYRDIIMFVLGAGGFVHELVFQGVERPFILTACLALMGFPLVLGAESGGRKKKEE